MGRKKIYATKQEANRERAKRFYEKNKERLKKERMQRYWEGKK